MREHRTSIRRAAVRGTDEERDRLATRIAEVLDAPMSALGIIFLLVVVAQAFTAPGSTIATVFDVAAWLLWAVFVIEFLARFMVAPAKGRFLRRNWWQVVLLVIPFMRFLRVLRAVRLARAGRIVSSAVRTSRSARQELTSRIGWLCAATCIVILASSQLLFEFGDYASYAEALHGASLAVISGEPLGRDEPFSDVVEVFLALYSVVVFAAVAASMGAFFLERRQRRATA